MYGGRGWHRRAFYTRLGATYADDLEIWRLDAPDLARVANGANGVGPGL